MESKKTSRREFVTASLLASVGIAGCVNDHNAFTPDAEVTPSGEKVKLLSVDYQTVRRSS
jgi:hypothetical protein